MPWNSLQPRCLASPVPEGPSDAVGGGVTPGPQPATMVCPGRSGHKRIRQGRGGFKA